MSTSRLEAFSDGVLAIVITIMVLEMKVQHGASVEDLRPILPVFLSYILSFAYLGIYWNNHHHLMHITQRVSGGVLWANLHLLFWLSLIPFVTGWMGENDFAQVPVALYGVVLLMSAIAWHILQYSIIRGEGDDSQLKTAIGRDWKGKTSAVCYVVGVVASMFWVPAALMLYVLVAVMWLIPDRRIERTLQS